MEIALRQAYKGCKRGDGGPFGCCVVKGGQVIACGHNTVLKDNDPIAHAEINAIRRAAKQLKTWNLKKCQIYTTTEPCPMCFSAISWARIDKIVYGTTIKDAQKLGFNEMLINSARMKRLASLNIKIEKGFMREECQCLLDFWKKLRLKVY
ncbi:MAG: nucleoside deaminase [Candidatus Omnitrophota bacterium]|nr:nucleoside deaminase [Candidatus Omnitrophota bacterium]